MKGRGRGRKRGGGKKTEAIALRDIETKEQLKLPKKPESPVKETLSTGPNMSFHFPVASGTCSQLRSENIQWKILEISNV